MTRFILSFVFAVAGGYLCAAAAAGERLEDIVVTNYDYTNAAWTRGSLTAVASGTKSEITIDFSFRDGKLYSLKARSRRWLVDLSAKIVEVAAGYPTRAQILVYKLDKKNEADGIVISLPFLSVGGVCKSRDFHIENSALIDFKDSTTSIVRCER